MAQAAAQPATPLSQAPGRAPIESPTGFILTVPEKGFLLVALLGLLWWRLYRRKRKKNKVCSHCGEVNQPHQTNCRNCSAPLFSK